MCTVMRQGYKKKGRKMAFKRIRDTETQGQKIRTNFHRKNKVCERKQGELSCGSQTEHKCILMIVKKYRFCMYSIKFKHLNVTNMSETEILFHSTVQYEIPDEISALLD